MKEHLLSDYFKFNEYRYKRGEITKEQYHSFNEFLKTHNLSKKEVDAFLAYTYLLPDKILTSNPRTIETIFFQTLHNIVGLKEGRNIKSKIESKYYTLLAKYILSIKDEPYSSCLFRDYFKKSLNGNYKKEALKEFKKLYKNDIKALKKSGIDFNTLSSLSFSKTLSTPFEKEEGAILFELNSLIKKSLGSFEKADGALKNPKKVYTKLEKYLVHKEVAHFSHTPGVLDILFSHAYKDEKESYYKTALSILKKRINDIKKYPKEIEISIWERNPYNDIFLGTEIDTCLSVSRGNFFCMLEYLSDFFTLVVVIKAEDEIIGLSYIFLVTDDSDYITFLFDNVELKDHLKGQSFFTDVAVEYFTCLCSIFKRDYFFIGTNYNDILFPGLSASDMYLEKLGQKSLEKKFYVDTFLGYDFPKGHVKVIKI